MNSALHWQTPEERQTPLPLVQLPGHSFVAQSGPPHSGSHAHSPPAKWHRADGVQQHPCEYPEYPVL